MSTQIHMFGQIMKFKKRNLTTSINRLTQVCKCKTFTAIYIDVIFTQCRVICTLDMQVTEEMEQGEKQGNLSI